MVVIQFKNGDMATYANYEWTSSNEVLAKLLTLSNWFTDISGADPDIDMTYALSAISRFGGKIISHTLPIYSNEVEY